MDPTFNLRHLRAVAAIIESGSVSSAATVVNLTQPAITQAIAKLEQQTGVRLFHRTATGMEATEAGRILAGRGERASQLIGSNRVTTPQMRAFIALARNGSYASAATATRTREPSLHRAVADLSVAVGYKLVERRGRGVALTARGAAVARRLRLAQAEINAAIEELEGLRGREVGRIAVGAMPLSRAQLIPNAIGQFQRSFPEVEIAIVEGSYAELVGPLREGEIDMMVGAIRESVSKELVQKPLFVDRPIILGRAGHPLASARRGPTVDELAAFPWIMPALQTPLRSQWAEMFGRSGVSPPRVPVECGSVLVIRQLLMQDDYLTLLSPAQVAVELEAGWLTRICAAPGGPKRTIGVTHRSEWRPTPLQQCFVDTLASQAKAIGTSES